MGRITRPIYYPCRLTDDVLLGPGKMGFAIVEGLLSSNHPWDILACVRSASSESKLLGRFGASSSVRVARVSGLEQVAAYVSPSDLVLLATKPQDAIPILENDDIRTALQGKLLISVVFGLSEDAMRLQLGPSATQAYILSALPNIAASVRHSATVTTAEPSSLKSWPESTRKLCSLFLSGIGSVHPVEARVLNAAATLSGTMPAFLGEATAGLLDGAHTAGVEKETASAIMVQGLRGLADLIEHGGDVDAIITSVATKGGVTEAGLNVLREGELRKLISKAFLESKQKLGP